jgi:hypothetical protein
VGDSFKDFDAVVRIHPLVLTALDTKGSTTPVEGREETRCIR